MKPTEIYSKLFESGYSNDGTEELRSAIDTEWSTIKARYPKLFDGEDIGTEVGAGWWELLEDAFKEITAALNAMPGATFSVAQIKEKFGGLRFYYDMSNESLSDDQYSALRAVIGAAVGKAEERADRTCEICGEPGERRSTSWLMTLCDQHYEIAKKRERA